jgi:hypothetical protein
VSKIFEVTSKTTRLEGLPVMTPESDVIKLFTVVIYNKLECLSLANLFKSSLIFVVKIRRLP